MPYYGVAVATAAIVLITAVAAQAMDRPTRQVGDTIIAESVSKKKSGTKTTRTTIDRDRRE